MIGFGLTTADSPRVGMPGWPSTSWGSHGDDGKLFHDGYWGSDYVGQGYGQGDIVGCLYDLEKNELSFTHKGVMLGKY